MVVLSTNKLSEPLHLRRQDKLQAVVGPPNFVAVLDVVALSNLFGDGDDEPTVRFLADSGVRVRSLGSPNRENAGIPETAPADTDHGDERSLTAG